MPTSLEELRSTLSPGSPSNESGFLSSPSNGSAEHSATDASIHDSESGGEENGLSDDVVAFERGFSNARGEDDFGRRVPRGVKVLDTGLCDRVVLGPQDDMKSRFVMKSIDRYADQDWAVSRRQLEQIVQLGDMDTSGRFYVAARTNCRLLREYRRKADNWKLKYFFVEINEASVGDFSGEFRVGWNSLVEHPIPVSSDRLKEVVPVLATLKKLGYQRWGEFIEQRIQRCSGRVTTGDYELPLPELIPYTFRDIKERKPRSRKRVVLPVEEGGEMGRPSLNLDVYDVSAAPLFVSPTRVDLSSADTRVQQSKDKGPARETTSRVGAEVLMRDGIVAKEAYDQRRNDKDAAETSKKRKAGDLPGRVDLRESGKRTRNKDKATDGEVDRVGVENVGDVGNVGQDENATVSRLNSKISQIMSCIALYKQVEKDGYCVPAGTYEKLNADLEQHKEEFANLDVLEVTEADFRYNPVAPQASPDLLSFTMETNLSADDFGMHDSWGSVESRVPDGRGVDDDADSAHIPPAAQLGSPTRSSSPVARSTEA
ncbi:hypothetical protein AALP_AA6G231700 [Arabis alpina]|uniref:Uncharacterized protein n=1 Tax=Arabis alpina TaxID=50452 RepID=A0A087GR60_ARAAL|nr:hypothetical protein AALP_AA6G231700 [Arabis alpina]